MLRRRLRICFVIEIEIKEVLLAIGKCHRTPKDNCAISICCRSRESVENIGAGEPQAEHIYGAEMLARITYASSGMETRANNLYEFKTAGWPLPIIEMMDVVGIGK